MIRIKVALCEVFRFKPRIRNLPRDAHNHAHEASQSDKFIHRTVCVFNRFQGSDCNQWDYGVVDSCFYCFHGFPVAFVVDLFDNGGCGISKRKLDCPFQKLS